MKSLLTVILFSFLSLTLSYAGIDNPVTAWKFQTKGPIRGGIVASGNSVYFGSADGHVYSIDKSSGKLNWKFKNVVVFAYQDVPENIYGADPSKGLLRRYLESGGKVLWIGGLPKRYLVNEKGQFHKEDSSIGPLLVGLEPDYPLESGNYYNTSTQEGLNWGLPELHNAAYGIFAPQAAVTPLAINEVGQLSIWVKTFTNQVGTGFVSCRTWPLHQAIPDEHLHLLYRIAAYGLQ